MKVDNNIIKDVEGTLSFSSQQTIICSTNDDCNDNTACTIDACNTETKQCTYSPTFDKECGTYGKPTVLAIRTIAPDAQTTHSSSEISNSLFGTNGQNFTMISQFSDCSYSSFQPMPFSGTTTTGKIISNGVAEVTITTYVIGEPTGLIQSLALEEANIAFGDLQTQFDFVMLLIPPGTVLASATNWKAYAYIDHWISVYNDAWSIYPSVHMHEIGHNIGLSHSHDETSYGDGSCLMGASPEITNGPRKCFNGPKSWQLGWYHAIKLSIDVEKISGNYYQLYGISDYDKEILQLSFTAIKLTNTADSLDYYLTFNSKRGITIDTEDGENSVLVSRRTAGSLYGDSFILARLRFDASSYTFNAKRDGTLF